MKKNWKTTLLGILGAALFTFGSAAQNRANNPSAPAITFGNIAPAVAIAALGAACKDHDGE